MEEALKELDCIRRQIKNVQSRQSAKRRLAVQAEFLVPRPLQKRVLLVYMYSGHCSQVAAEFLRRCFAGCQAAAEESMDYEAVVEDLYLAAPLDEIVDLETAPLTCVRTSDALAAMEFTVQQKLHSWVASLNTEKGVAPSRSMMVAYAMDNIPSAVPDELRAGLVQRLNGSPRAQRKWLARFRRQWQCRVGRLPVEDVVTAFWQWINFAWAEAEEAKETPLVLNADETCIAWVKGLSGTVAKTTQARCAADRASLAQRRSNFTLLACICAESRIQPLLPQFILVNKRQITMKELAVVKGLLPPQTYVVRGQSAWCSHELLRRFLTALATSLEPVSHGRYIILLLDCAACHLHDSIRSH
ncbi:unnamed protein product, partial [Symbiodinium necroappetens]